MVDLGGTLSLFLLCCVCSCSFCGLSFLGIFSFEFIPSRDDCGVVGGLYLAQMSPTEMISSMGCTPIHFIKKLPSNVREESVEMISSNDDSFFERISLASCHCMHPAIVFPIAKI